MRCFTFQSFQLAHTLEEFGQILGYSLENGKPYCYLEKYPKTAKIARVLKVYEHELKAVKRVRKGVISYLRSFFENRARQLAELKDWDTFMEVLALIIFGVVLFPNADDLIDRAAIDVFLAFRHRNENPVPAVLADVYYTFNYCHEKKGKRILCCLPALYVWLVTHVFHHGNKVLCPFLDFKWCGVKAKSSREWAQYLANLNENTVRWYPKWKETQEIIYQCGAFPNVPLMGTRGCINYNPALVLRQLCYPIMGPPTEEVTTPFVLYDMGPESTEMLRKVRQAWDKVTKRGRDLGKRSCGVKESYRQWLRERVEKVKIPFHSSLPIVEETPAQLNVEDDETGELKVALLKAEEEKRSLQGELVGVRRAYEKLQMENVQKMAFFEKANKRAKIEEDHRFRIQEDLRASDESLTKRRQERDQALIKMGKLEELWRKSKVAEEDTKRQLGDLKLQLKGVVAEYEKRVANEKELVTIYHDLWRKEQAVVNGLRDQVREQQGITEDLERGSIYWMDRCSKLVWLANVAIEDIPEYLDRAEAMINPLSTPREITGFIGYCKNLVEQMGEHIRGNR